AKILALLAENRSLQGHTAAKRFEGRVPPAAPLRASILRNLGRMDQCSTRILAFNLNTLVDSKKTPLPRLLLSQYYQSRGYSSNLLVARAVEYVLDGRGQLAAFHDAVTALAGKSWDTLRQNLSPFAHHVYAAAAKIAPDLWPKPESVKESLHL